MSRFRVWTGPTSVKVVADALRLVPEVHDVIEGTEHVIFDSPDATGEDVLKRAHHIGETRPCWSFLAYGGARRVFIEPFKAREEGE